MGSMTVPARISDFLIQRLERMYCDTCIQERLGLKWRQQVQLITATLGVTIEFRRETDRCCTCEQTKQVTCAAYSRARADLSEVSIGPRRREIAPNDLSTTLSLKARISRPDPGKSRPTIYSRTIPGQTERTSGQSVHHENLELR
jgi:hypothetical protein